MKWLWLIIAILFPVLLPGQTATITWGTTFQIIDGFGAHDIAWPGQFNTSTTVLNQLFTTSGNNVGLSILRVSVPDAGPGNTGTDPAGNCASVGTSCAGITTEQTFAFNNGVRIFAVPWSPPAIYKTNSNIDCQSGGGNGALNPADYGLFATWLSNYLTSMVNGGITVYALTPQNEPNACQSGYGAALWSAANFDTFLKTNLGPTMSAAGQLSQTLLAIPETGGHGALPTYATTAINDAAANQYISLCTDHEYGLSSYPNNPLASNYTLCSNANHRLWMTEIYNGTTYNGTMTDGIIWAQDIHNWLANANASAWLYWQIFSPYNDNEPLYQPGTTTPAQRLFVIGQWSKFIRPGWLRMAATANPTTNVFVTAAKAPDNSAYAIVAVNNSTAATNLSFSFSGFPTVTTVTPYITCDSGSAGCASTLQLASQATVNVSSGSFTYSLPAKSVTTLYGLASPAAPGCPTNSQYLATVEPGYPLVNIAANGILQCYYIASTGSDSNAGTRASPWAHIPGMPTWTGTHVPVAGDAYLLRGGDTWGSTNFTINWTWSGTQTNPIYVGVDNTWYSGTAWARPIWNAQQQLLGNFFFGRANWWIVDNVEMTGVFWRGTVAGLAGTNGVTSCGTNTMFENSYEHGWSWTTPWTNTNGPAPNNGGSSAEFEIGQGCDQGTGGTVGVAMRYNVLDGSDTADKTAAVITQGAPIAIPIAYGNYSTWGTWGALDGCGDNWHDNVSLNMGIPVNSNASTSGTATATNGSTTLTLVSGGPFIGGSITIGSTNYNISGGTGSSITLTAAFTGATGTVSFSQSASFHQNGFKHLGSCNNTNIFSYNNVVGNQVAWSGDGGAVKYWFQGACGSYTTWAWNDVIFNTGNGNVTDFGSEQHAACGNGTLNLFNSTFQCGRDSAPGGCSYGKGQLSGATMTLNTSNMHWIGAGTSICTGLCPSGGFSINETNPLYQNVATANAQGYTSTSTYAFQPTSPTGGTVVSGSSIAANCSAITAINAFAGSQCGNDTSYGISYNSTNHTVSYGPGRTQISRPQGGPNLGAYQYGATPTLSISPTSMNFGNVNVGFNGTAQTATVTNTGTASATLSSACCSISGLNALDFFTSGGTCTNNLVIAVGGTCTIGANVTPSQNGAESAQLNIFSNAPSVSTSLAATGIGGVSVLSPSSLTFGSYPIGTTSPSQSVTLTNNGPGLLTLNSITISTNFIQTNTCVLGSAMAVGATCTFTVQFKPTVTGVLSGTITISDNGQNNPETVSLTGTGLGQGQNCVLSNGEYVMNGMVCQ
jgi:glucuronoarabinoxylan endo-1,4-beta-xylanase